MTTNEQADAMIERLRHCSTNTRDEYLHELAGRSANMITALVAERDKALDTVKRVQAAARTLDVTRQQIADTYARNSAINKEAVETLDSERAANAILTAELAATREALAVTMQALREIAAGALPCTTALRALATLAKGAATDD